MILGGKPDCDYIVVALTSISVTHYFKLKLPTTRPARNDGPCETETQRSCEVVWHHKIVLEEYPLASEDQLLSFIQCVHAILDETM